MTNQPSTPPAGRFVVFTAADGRARVECRFESDTLWLSQAAMADLYQVTPQAITQNIRAVYEEGEPDQNSTCKDYLLVQMEGAHNDRNVLVGAGSVSKKDADAKAAAEYECFAEHRRRLKEQAGENDIEELLHWKPPQQ